MFCRVEPRLRDAVKGRMLGESCQVLLILLITAAILRGWQTCQELLCIIYIWKGLTQLSYLYLSGRCGKTKLYCPLPVKVFLLDAKADQHSICSTLLFLSSSFPQIVVIQCVTDVLSVPLCITTTGQVSRLPPKF